MWWLTWILLVLLGILGIAAWLKSRQPDAGKALAPLESAAGWIGLIGLIWGLYYLIRLLLSLSRYMPVGWFLLGLITALVIIALSLILAAPVLRGLFGVNAFTARTDALAARLAGYRLPLGFACLGLALYMLLNRLF